MSKEEFSQVQRKIVDRKKVRPCNKAKEVYLLSGKIFCGECGYIMAGNKKSSGRNKTIHITYRCMGRKSKHICSNKEMRREYIEAYVLEKLSEYIFDKKLITKLAKEYTAYQLVTNADVIAKKDSIKNRINEITKEINNLITVVAKTGSDMMAERIGELETEKHYLDASYEQVCFQSSVQDVTVETLTERFNEAKAMLKTGELSTTKSLIELFINKVNVYLDHIEIIFNFHPDLVPPDTFDSHKEDYESSVEESPSNSYSDTILDNKKVSTLVGGYCGGAK